MDRRNRVLLVKTKVASAEKGYASQNRSRGACEFNDCRHSGRRQLHTGGSIESKSSNQNKLSGSSNMGNSIPIRRRAFDQFFGLRQAWGHDEQPCSKTDTNAPASKPPLHKHNGNDSIDESSFKGVETASNICVSSPRCTSLAKTTPPSNATVSECSDQKVDDTTTNPSESSSISDSLRCNIIQQKPCSPEFRCNLCQGDVRIPTLDERDPAQHNNARNVDICCTSPYCKSPRYHLQCSGVPSKSQIFHNATNNFNSTKVGKSFSTGPVAQTSHTAWWNIPISNDLHSNNDNVNGQLSSTDSLFGSFQLFHQDPMCSISSFICPSCDVEGSSRYLLEYFELFHAMKKSFYSRFLNDDVPVRKERMSESVESRTGYGILSYLAKIHAIDSGEYDEQLLNRLLPSEINLSHVENVLQFLHSHATQHQIQIDSIDGSNTKDNNEKKRPLEGITPQYLNQNESQQSSLSKKIKTDFGMTTAVVEERTCDMNPEEKIILKRDWLHSREANQANQPSYGFDSTEQNRLDPTYLVGLPIMVFNPVDNSYHSGRIVDYKLNAPIKFDDTEVCFMNIFKRLLDKRISDTMYLVRFREGVDGRKVAIHQWIYLEEHAVKIGGEVCWAKISDGLDLLDHTRKNARMSPYRPVQIVFRSVLERIYTLKQSPEAEKATPFGFGAASCPTVLAMGFGNAFSYVRIPLQVDDFTTEQSDGIQCEPVSCTASSSHRPKSSKETNKVFDTSRRPNIFPFGANDPLWLNQILQNVRLCDEDIVVAMASASAEQDANRRVRCSIKRSQISS